MLISKLMKRGLYQYKRKRFLKRHRVPFKKERYLGLGAMFIYINDPTERVLDLRLNPDQIASMLRTQWQIIDKVSAKAVIEKIRQEPLPICINIDEASKATLKLFYERIEPLIRSSEKYGFSHDAVLACRDPIAWNIERAAFLARNCYHVGYLAEAEVWNLLVCVLAPIVRQHFGHWQQYAFSVLVGRALTCGGAPDCILHAMKQLLLSWGYRSIWRRFPLHFL